MSDHASSMQSVTALLEKVQSGEKAAIDDLFREVYSDLRVRAHLQRRRWKGNPSLQTTALLNEAYLKLVHPSTKSWKSRSHFLAASARAMRHILIDRARKKRRQKRGGDAPKLSLEALKERLGREVAMTGEDAEAIVLLHEALERFEEVHKRAAKGVECRFFAGMTIDEAAEALDVSTATIKRDWRLARLWLYREMKRVHEV